MTIIKYNGCYFCSWEADERLVERPDRRSLLLCSSFEMQQSSALWLLSMTSHVWATLQLFCCTQALSVPCQRVSMQSKRLLNHQEGWGKISSQNTFKIRPALLYLHAVNGTMPYILMLTTKDVCHLIARTSRWVAGSSITIWLLGPHVELQQVATSKIRAWSRPIARRDLLDFRANWRGLDWKKLLPALSFQNL